VAEVAVQHCDFKLDGARVAVQGFGAVGKHAARFLKAKGTVLIAAADSQGTIYNPQGLDVEALIELKQAGKSVIAYPDGKRLEREAVIDLECDLWIPAARPDVIHEDNVERLQTKLIIQGANIPITPGAEKYLHQKGVLCIPDFIANAGGVICAAMEYRGASEVIALEVIEEKLRRNTEQVLETSRKEQILPRQAAVELAVERVKKAMSYRRWSLFSTAPGFI
jgi:glutamate dehydrogenase (NAD(P)+)